MAVVCTNLGILYDTTEYDSGRCLFRWKCTASGIDHFEVLGGYYSTKQKIWVQDDSSMNADTNNVDGWFQQHWSAPDASVAVSVRFYVRAVLKRTTTDDRGNEKTYDEYGAWVVSGEVTSPRYLAEASQAEKVKYEFQTERPDAPTMTIVSSSNTQVVLGFRATSPRVGSIEIQRRMDGGSWGTLAYKDRAFGSTQAPYIDHDPWPIVGTTNYTDKTIQAGHTYEYRARCLNTSEQYVTNISGSSKTYTFNGYEPKNDVTKGRFDGPYGEFCTAQSVGTLPVRPQFDKASLAGPSSVKLWWIDGGKNTSEYDVQYSSYRSSTGQNAWNAGALEAISHMTVPYPAQQETMDGTRYSVATVTGLSYGTLYDFRVYSKNAPGEAVSIYVASDDKSYGTRSVTIPAEPAPTVAAPKSFKGTYASPDWAILTWNGVLENEASYTVEHSLYSNAWSVNAGQAIDDETDITANTYTWINLERGKFHYFKVFKVKGDAKVGSSNTVKVSIPANTSADNTPTNTASSIVNGNIRLTWNGVALGSGESYQVQYTDDSRAFADNIFDSISEATLEESAGTSHVLTISGLEEGTEYWCRVRWRGESAASNWASFPKATTPLSDETREQLEAPTPTTTLLSYMLDEEVPLSWVHNSGEDTAQTDWQVQLGGSVSRTINSTQATKGDSATMLDLSSLGIGDGSNVTWRVRTQGAWAGYWSPWSKTQAFSVYSRPVATIGMSQNPVTTFPFSIDVNAVSQGGGTLPIGNRPLTCSVTISPTEDVETPQPDGSSRVVSAGEPVWSGYYDTSSYYEDGEGWSIPVYASDVSLVATAGYRVSATVSTMQGMRCEAAGTFSCEWDGEVPAPRATVVFDAGALACRISPWAEEFIGFDPVTGEMMFELAEGLVLSVFRVNADGTTEPIASGIENDGDTWVEDPHCSFGTCTYRIVATDPETGAQGSDEYSVATPYKRVVVEFGSETVELRFNLEWTEEHKPDVEYLAFHGRSNPVAHWGTQTGQSFKIHGSLAKGTDAITLAKLRLLANYRGACYVREPTGIAWWASVIPTQMSGAYRTAEQRVELDIVRLEA